MSINSSDYQEHAPKSVIVFYSISKYGAYLLLIINLVLAIISFFQIFFENSFLGEMTTAWSINIYMFGILANYHLIKALNAGALFTSSPSVERWTMLDSKIRYLMIYEIIVYIYCVFTFYVLTKMPILPEAKYYFLLFYIPRLIHGYSINIVRAYFKVVYLTLNVNHK